MCYAEIDPNAHRLARPDEYGVLPTQTGREPAARVDRQ